MTPPPAESVAAQVTTCVPIANRLPEAGKQVTASGPSQLSDAVGMGSNTTMAPSVPVGSFPIWS